VTVREALLVQYVGVYAAPPSVAQLGKNDQAAGQQLSYTVVRPSTVTAELVGPDGSARPVDSGQRQPGSYRFSAGAFDTEGTWRWRVTATDDQNRQSVAERPFQVDFTLSALKVAGTTPKVGFTLSRPASVTLQIETRDGAVVSKLPPQSLEAGTQSLTWDGTTSAGAMAPRGSYVARVTATSSVGTSALTVPFTLRG
jgi:hypothetical protein